MQAKNLNILRFGMWFLVVLLVFLVLYVGKGLIVPLVLAVFIFYLINILADGLADGTKRVSRGKFQLPRTAAVVVAIFIIAFLFSRLFSLITSNLSELGNKWPAYQERLQSKLNDAYDRWEAFVQQVQTFQPANTGEEPVEPPLQPNLVETPGTSEFAEPRFDPALELASPRAPPETGLRPSFDGSPPQISDIFAEVRVTEILTRAVGALTGTIGFTGLMVIYLIFLFIEQRSFGPKLEALMGNRVGQTTRVLQQIDSDIRKYLGVKTFTSLVTGLISYVVMRVVGLSFAEFWAVLIFLLNFIPSIGSIIATIFPTILALVDGNSLWPFIIVGGGITALQFAIGNIIEPRLMGNTLNLSPLIILLSLALWGSIWGVAGAVLCVPITVICTIVCSYFPTTRPIAVLLSKNGQLKNLQDEESPTAPPAKAGAQTDPQLGEPRNDGKLSENSTRPHPVPDAS